MYRDNLFVTWSIKCSCYGAIIWPHISEDDFMLTILVDIKEIWLLLDISSTVYHFIWMYCMIMTFIWFAPDDVMALPYIMSYNSISICDQQCFVWMSFSGDIDPPRILHQRRPFWKLTYVWMFVVIMHHG